MAAENDDATLDVVGGNGAFGHDRYDYGKVRKRGDLEPGSDVDGRFAGVEIDEVADFVVGMRRSFVQARSGVEELKWGGQRDSNRLRPNNRKASLSAL